MLISIKSIQGLGRIPSDRTAASRWIENTGIPISVIESDGRKPQVVNLSDLPAPERRAYNEHRIAGANLPVGLYDEDAHADFFMAPITMQKEAQRKAEIAELLLIILSTANWDERESIVRGKFGNKGTSKSSLMRILSAVKGVDPINYAPALLAGHKGRTVKAETNDQAWSAFMTIIRDAAPDFPIIQAWRDVRDLSGKNSWVWPPYVTINRRWNALPDAQRLVALYGREEASKRLSIPDHRDKTTINALEWVSLDGRTLDFWTDMGDDRAVRLTMLALIDVASNMVLDYELAASENAVDTVRLIRRTCQTYGIFDRLYPDNGSSFAGHLVAGGNVHRFRNKATMDSGVKPLGICYHLGIKIHFALPGNAQAKIAERTFASLSRVIDDRPEFKSAHAGHNPGAAPASNVEPVPFEAVQGIIRREVERYNRESGRRSQGAKGRSYQGVFKASLAERVIRRPTARQLYLAGLIYKPVSVNRHGQIVVDTWIYGSPSTQGSLLPFHGTGKQILLGHDPDDLSAPAIAFDEDGRLICEGIEYVERGRYDSVQGIRTAASNRKAARNTVARAEEANNYLTDSELASALAALDLPETEPMIPSAKVVGARFGSPLRDVKYDTDKMDSVPAEYLRNMDTLLAEKRAKEEKLA